MKALSTLEIDNILKNNAVTKHKFMGTFPSCMYPRTTRREYCFITNTDDHTQSGIHWIAWYIKNSTVSLFDSFGRSPSDDYFPEQYLDFIRKFRCVKYAKRQIQKTGSTSCGYFCIHFIYLLSLGLDFEGFLEEYFDLKNSDNVVYRFFNSIIYLLVLLSQIKQRESNQI